MGVPGLTAWVHSRAELCEDSRLRGTALVVDGDALCHHLYRSAGLDQGHGGDYAGLAEEVCAWVCALRVCDVRPLVLLDGPAVPRKRGTHAARARERIDKALALARGERRGEAMPLLLREVFESAVRGCGVPCGVCAGEADRPVACAARGLRCPLLSADSDFYLAPLPGGFLHLRHLDWRRGGVPGGEVREEVRKEEEERRGSEQKRRKGRNHRRGKQQQQQQHQAKKQQEEQEQDAYDDQQQHEKQLEQQQDGHHHHHQQQMCYLPVRLFRQERLCAALPGLSASLLPLVPLLVGNDHTAPVAVRGLRGACAGSGVASGRVSAALHWLSGFPSADQAVAAIAAGAKASERESVRLAHRMLTQDYSDADEEAERFDDLLSELERSLAKPPPPQSQPQPPQSPIQPPLTTQPQPTQPPPQPTQPPPQPTEPLTTQPPPLTTQPLTTQPPPLPTEPLTTQPLTTQPPPLPTQPPPTPPQPPAPTTQTPQPASPPSPAVPGWVHEAVRAGRLSPAIVDAYTHRCVFMRVQVEEEAKASAHRGPALWVRRATYGLLAGGEGGSEGSAVAAARVTEFDRHGRSLRRFAVEPLAPRSFGAPQLSIHTVPHTPHAERLAFLLSVLGVDWGALEPVPPTLRLAVASVQQWMEPGRLEGRGDVAEGRDSLPVAHALLVQMACGHLGGAASGSVLAAVCPPTPPAPRSSPPRVSAAVAHALARWQSCLHAALALNQALMMPLPEPSLSRLYHGPLVHSVSRALASGAATPAGILAGSADALALHGVLAGALQQVLVRSSPGRPAAGSLPGRPRRKRDGRHRRCPRDGADGNRFEALGVDVCE